MKLILVRHGETINNLNNIIQGQHNTQLTQKGIEQAKKVSQRLKDFRIDIAFSSDLDRAVDTCNEILKFHKDTELVKSSVLREQAKGTMEGKTKEEARRITENIKTPYHEWMPEGGERIIDVWNRATRFIEKLKKESPEENILLVSHGGTISCILTYLHDKSIHQRRQYVPKENTAISIVNIDDEKIEFHTLNCAIHL